MLETKRPLLIFGAGIHIAHAEDLALKFARALNFPVVCTWGAIDLFHHDDPLYVGGFGTHGTRAANFAVQNADAILTIGTRLDTKATGTPASAFAPKAREVMMVDIDQAEIDKFKKLGREIIGVRADLRHFMQEKMPSITAIYPEWMARIKEWKVKYPPGMEVEGLNPYKVIEDLSELIRPDDVIVSDTGCPVGWMAQAFKFKGQRFIHAWNNTPMGYGLPAAVGAAFATNKRVVLVTGDGGLAVNITELATVARHKLPIKIVLFNNRSHAMCRQTQRTWLGGKYPSTSFEGGLANPDFNAVAKAYGFYIAENEADLLSSWGPAFLNLDIHPDYCIAPQVRFGRNLEDADPLLEREELAAIMT